MNEFLERMAEVLEVESIAPDEEFRAVPMWSSLAGFAMIVMCEQRYGRRLTVDEFMRCRTVADVARAAGVVE